MSTTRRATRCPGHARHWYSVHGMAGVRSPVCVRCGDPNPLPLDEDEWASLGWLRDNGLLRNPGIIRALAEHQAAS